MPKLGYKMKDHKYIRRDPKPGGGYIYIYEETTDSGSSQQTDNSQEANRSRTRKTGEWVKAWNNAKNASGMKSVPGGGSGSKGSKKAAKKGRKAVSKALSREAAEALNKKAKEKNEDKRSRVERDLETEKRKNEVYYRERLIAQKDKYKQELIEKMAVNGEVDDSIMAVIDDKVEQYGNALWEGTYKELLEKANARSEMRSKIEMRKYQ